MTANDSLAIKICRVMCIFFVMYVHVNPSYDIWLEKVPGNLPYIQYIGNILLNVLGRASVPALSVLGGYLAVSAYNRRSDWWKYAKERWQTIVIPMITWNIILIVLSVLIFVTIGASTDVIRRMGPFEQMSALVLADFITAYNNGSAAIALNFLRDIFVCSLLFPLINLLVKRFDVAGVGIIWLVGLTVTFSPIVQKASILMFFTAGVYFALHSTKLIPTPRVALKLIATLLIVFGLVYFLPALSAYAGRVPNIIFRVLVTTGFLMASIALSRVNAGKVLARLEPITYLLFLSHTTIFMVLWGVWQKLFGNEVTWPYPLFFIVAPIITVFIVYWLYKLVGLTPHKTQKILAGKKQPNNTELLA